jgi:hypothetical protein
MSMLGESTWIVFAILGLIGAVMVWRLARPR